MPNFHLLFKLDICPYFIENPPRLDSWMAFFIGILQTSLGEQFETPTESAGQIEELDKTEFWRLKGIVG